MLAGMPSLTQATVYFHQQKGAFFGSLLNSRNNNYAKNGKDAQEWNTEMWLYQHFQSAN